MLFVYSQPCSLLLNFVPDGRMVREKIGKLNGRNRRCLMYIIGMIMIIFRTKYIEKIIIAFTVKIQQVIVIPDRW